MIFLQSSRRRVPSRRVESHFFSIFCTPVYFINLLSRVLLLFYHVS